MIFITKAQGKHYTVKQLKKLLSNYKKKEFKPYSKSKKQQLFTLAQSYGLIKIENGNIKTNRKYV